MQLSGDESVFRTAPSSGTPFLQKASFSSSIHPAVHATTGTGQKPVSIASIGRRLYLCIIIYVICGNLFCTSLDISLISEALTVSSGEICPI